MSEEKFFSNPEAYLERTQEKRAVWGEWENPEILGHVFVFCTEKKQSEGSDEKTGMSLSDIKETEMSFLKRKIDKDEIFSEDWLIEKLSDIKNLEDLLTKSGIEIDKTPTDTEPLSVLATKRIIELISNTSTRKELSNLLSDDLFYEIVKRHNQEIQEKDRKLKEKITEYLLPNFLQKLPDFAKKHNITLNIENVKKLSENIIFKIYDPMFEDSSEKHGDYSSSRHMVRISALIPDEEIEDFFVHEMFHAISGRRERKELDDTEIKLSDVTKVGLGLVSRKEKKADVEYLVWLNEAVTEYLTILFLEKESSSYYVYDIKLLQLLLNNIKGLNPEDFFNAYFENFEKKNKQEFDHYTPATKNLFKKLGKGFLMQLDYLIKKKSNIERNLIDQQLYAYFEKFKDNLQSSIKKEIDFENIIKKASSEGILQKLFGVKNFGGDIPPPHKKPKILASGKYKNKKTP